MATDLQDPVCISAEDNDDCVVEPLDMKKTMISADLPCRNFSPEQEILVKTFPWMVDFIKLCTSDVGITNIRALEKLMRFYQKQVIPSVRDCYSRPNRAAKLKRVLADALYFFHMTYSDFKPPLEHSSYLAKMSDLMAMYMDMEIKTSRTGTESLPKIASKLTSSLHVYFGRSHDHVVDTILKSKIISKNFWELSDLVFRRVLRDSPGSSVYILSYIRYILAFKMWKGIMKEAEDRKKISQLAAIKLTPPANFREQMASGVLRDLLPKVPKARTDITTFLMQAKFPVRDKIKMFLKAVQDPKVQCFLDRQNFNNVMSSVVQDENECSTLMSDIWSTMNNDASISDPLRRSEKLRKLKNIEKIKIEIARKKKKKFDDDVEEIGEDDKPICDTVILDDDVPEEKTVVKTEVIEKVEEIEEEKEVPIVEEKIVEVHAVCEEASDDVDIEMDIAAEVELSSNVSVDDIDPSVKLETQTSYSKEPIIADTQWNGTDLQTYYSNVNIEYLTEGCKETEYITCKTSEPEYSMSCKVTEEPVYVSCKVTEPAYVSCNVTEPVYVSCKVTEPSYVSCKVTEQPVYVSCQGTEPVYVSCNVAEPVYVSSKATEAEYVSCNVTEPVYVSSKATETEFVSCKISEPEYASCKVSEPEYVSCKTSEPNYVSNKANESQYVSCKAIEPEYISSKAIETGYINCKNMDFANSKDTQFITLNEGDYISCKEGEYISCKDIDYASLKGANYIVVTEPSQSCEVVPQEVYQVIQEETEPIDVVSETTNVVDMQTSNIEIASSTHVDMGEGVKVTKGLTDEDTTESTQNLVKDLNLPPELQTNSFSLLHAYTIKSDIKMYEFQMKVYSYSSKLNTRTWVDLLSPVFREQSKLKMYRCYCAGCKNNLCVIRRNWKNVTAAIMLNSQKGGDDDANATDENGYSYEKSLEDLKAVAEGEKGDILYWEAEIKDLIRKLEETIKEDSESSSLPLKKRKAFSYAAQEDKQEMSYPSTPMISIAELVKDKFNYSVGVTHTPESSMVPNYVPPMVSHPVYPSTVIVQQAATLGAGALPVPDPSVVPEQTLVPGAYTTTFLPVAQEQELNTRRTFITPAQLKEYSTLSAAQNLINFANTSRSFSDEPPKRKSRKVSTRSRKRKRDY